MEQLDLSGPKTVEYEVSGSLWRCNAYDLLLAEFEVSQGELPKFHAMASSKGRAWLIARRLFGMMPVLPPADADPDDLRTWGREELRATLGLTKPQFQAELDSIRGGWEAGKPKSKGGKRAPKAAAEFKDEFDFAEEKLLRERGFPTNFRCSEDQTWFCERIRDFEKLFNEKATMGLARTTLMTELQMRQLDILLAEPDQVGKEGWRTNLKVRQDLDKAYNEQLKLIDKLAPWFGAVAGKASFHNVLSDLTRAMQDYEGRGDSRLVDGFMTAMEIKVEMRRSVQMPKPRYRAGLVTYVAAAREGLWDPHWAGIGSAQKPGLFKPSEMKKLDEAWQAALVAAGIAEGERVPDLEKDGADGEYEPLKQENAG